MLSEAEQMSSSVNLFSELGFVVWRLSDIMGHNMIGGWLWRENMCMTV